jgi:cell division protein FtsI (penicillin-binding protein 3)
VNFKKIAPHSRYIIVLSFLAVLLLYILGNYFVVMLIQPADAPRSTPIFPVVERGPILDRDGRLLAISTRLDTVTGWGPHIQDPMGVARKLGTALDMDPREIFDTIQEKRDGFFYIKRKITPSESKAVRALKDEGELRGINLQLEFGRRYPAKRMASHLLGYVGIDNTGLAGLEYSLNGWLSPEKIGSSNVVGNSVYLTLDLPLQHYVNEIAQKAMEEHDPDSMMVLVAHAKTGEILSYTSLPDYDPNTYNEFESNDRYNRPLAKAYEPGSVFKVFSLASFLDNQAISLSDTFFSKGYYERILDSGERILINDLGPRGVISVPEILMFSSNAGIGYASDNIDRDDFYQYLRAFGFGENTGFPLIGETAGILADVQDWSARSKPTIALGQEISVSALQLLSAATTLANDGVRLKPILIDKILSGTGETLQDYQREEVGRVLRPGVSESILGIMNQTAIEGGSRRIAIPGLSISAKTGTAQVADPENGGYSDEVFIASIMALFPTENPQYIVYVALEYPKGPSIYGGVIAAPIGKEIIQAIVDLKGVPLDNDTVYLHPTTISPPQTKELVLGDQMPDLIGYSKRQLLPLLLEEGLLVSMEGSGWVVEQNPAPGSPIVAGSQVFLRFE